MYGLSENVLRSICNVFRCFPNITQVLLFGSRAKGTYHEGSDIDLAIVGEGITFRQLLDMGAQIESLGLLYKVDLVDYGKNETKPIGEHIRRVGIPIYEKETANR